jgi:hypothetical protein
MSHDPDDAPDLLESRCWLTVRMAATVEHEDARPSQDEVIDALDSTIGEHGVDADHVEWGVEGVDPTDTEREEQLRELLHEAGCALLPFAEMAEGKDNWKASDNCAVFPKLVDVRTAREVLGSIREVLDGPKPRRQVYVAYENTYFDGPACPTVRGIFTTYEAAQALIEGLYRTRSERPERSDKLDDYYVEPTWLQGDEETS